MMVKKILTVFLSLILFSSCAGKEKEVEEVKKTVGRYNILLTEAQKTGDLSGIALVVSKYELKKLDHFITGYIKQNKIMEAEIKATVFNEVKVKNKTAIVRTSEDWAFRWVDYKTRQEVMPLQDVHYEMIYYLFNENGKWMIDKTEEVSDQSAAEVKRK